MELGTADNVGYDRRGRRGRPRARWMDADDVAGDIGQNVRHEIIEIKKTIVRPTIDGCHMVVGDCCSTVS